MKRRPWFAIALILDFSVPKTGDVAKQSFHEFKSVTVISYGARTGTEDIPSSCNHAKMQSMPADQFPKWIAKQEPSKTAPKVLAESINKISFELEFSLRNIKDVVIVSDGKDTCHQDPCKAFDALDKIATHRREGVRVQFIGNLKCDSSHWKSLKWINSNDKTLGQALAFASHAELSDKGSPAVTKTVAKKSRTPAPSPAPTPSAAPAPSPSPSTSPNATDIANSLVLKQKNAVLATANIVIPDAPDSAKFEAAAVGFDAKAEWRARDPMELQVGHWVIKVTNYTGVSLPIELAPNEHKQLKFYRDFPLPASKLSLEGPPLALRFDPLDSQNKNQQVRAHGGDKLDLPPGHWNVVIESPSWVKSVPLLPWYSDPGESQTLSLADSWEDAIDFVRPPPDYEMLLVMGEEGSEHRVLIPAGSPPVPIPKSTNWKLIRLESASKK